MSAPIATLERLELPLVHPFTIARGEERTARSILLRLRDPSGVEGVGETAPSMRYGESCESVEAYLRAHPPAIADPFLLETVLDAAIPPAARCALDIALHDLIAKRLGIPLYAWLGLDPDRTLVTSFTIGIASREETLAKVAAVGDHPILKVKLGIGSDDEQIETVAAIRGRYRGTIRIDANEGWTPLQAVRILRALEPYDIEFCEQPIPAGNPGALRYLREHTRIPLVADEDAREASDLRALIGCVDGVNVKLVKCGGIRAAHAMIRAARALGFKVMLGCMVESAIATTAAAHLSPLADWADLDGPFLTARDPFAGVTYDHGKLVLPREPGLGVRERIAA
jgi:L-alanine-DL-glutamate epimerase-like enolase superfamily enzyme